MFGQLTGQREYEVLVEKWDIALHGCGCLPVRRSVPERLQGLMVRCTRDWIEAYGKLDPSNRAWLCAAGAG